MSKKRLLSIVVSAVILLSFACTAMDAEKSERYVGDSTAVSYTHLDVYKRQVYNNWVIVDFEVLMMKRCMIGTVPISVRFCTCLLYTSRCV